MSFNLSGLKIYNSSAGSGKTYSLIKEYLLILFNSNNIYMFRHILVITFTNKVAKEIKLNILHTLNELSQGIESDLLIFIADKLNKSYLEIQLKAKNILITIIHNYGVFDIHTIDKFYYKIITQSNINLKKYEEIKIEFNTNYIVKKTVKILLSQLSKSDYYSKFLIDFFINEMKEGNTWNPYHFLMKLSELLIKEEKIFNIEQLKNYSINDFIILNNTLNNKIINIKKDLKNQSFIFFQELKKRNILIKSFYRSLLPLFFKKLSKKFLFSDINNILKKKLYDIIIYNNIYSKNIDITQKKIIDSFSKKIKYFYIKSKKYLYEFMLYSYIKRNILCIITLYKLKEILYKIKKDKNILFNIDIYQIINTKLNNNYISNIYEIIGDRYSHYFIDEFQDTSILQWQNIQELIENAISENGYVVIAGDIKQSIYRWRGSDIQQFINLINSNYNNYKKIIKYSDINYRSYKQIVYFNNLLYSSINQKFFNKQYEKIYQENIKQKSFKEIDGYVELNFMPSKNNYIINIYNKIKKKIFEFLEKGYQAMEIAILVRKNEEGVKLFELFNSDGISVLNYDYILLKNCWQIKCIIGLFRILSSPDDIIIRVKWLIFLKKINKIQCDEKKIHYLLSEVSLLSIDLFFKKLFLYGIDFHPKYYITSSIIHITEKIINAIKLNEKTSVIIIQFFLDFILNNIEYSGNSITRFLEIWDLKKDTEYISLSEDINAIKIMTIHKSKGLEFPIVFLPFLDWQIFREKDIYAWNNINSNILNTIDIFTLKKKYYILYLIIDAIQKQYNIIKDKIYIDNINLLYVATTRAIEQLILFTYNSDNTNKISFFLKNFLIKEKIFIKNKITYTFGKSENRNFLYKDNINTKNFDIYYNKNYSYVSYQKNNISKKSIYNNISDDLKYQSLIMIRYISNIDRILNKIFYKNYFNHPDIFQILKKNILSIVHNIRINNFFKEVYKILFQCEIIFENEIIIINRLIFYYEKVIIINYITNGSYNIHMINTKNSIKALSNMGYKNIEAILIIVRNKIEIINI